MSVTAVSNIVPGKSFRHEAVLYVGIDDFLDRTTTFVAECAAAGEAILVAVHAEKIALLQQRLGSSADSALFVDMTELGCNPARIIPAWQSFLDDHPSAVVRGIGEPIWVGRSRDEIVESQRHEALLNTAFADGRAWHLVCPYDVSSLPQDVIDEALRTHPTFSRSGERRPSDLYEPPTPESIFGSDLPPPVGAVTSLAFGYAPLADVRAQVRRESQRAGLPSSRTEDLLIAVTEIAGNSLRHGGGEGVLRSWIEAGAFVCEITDSGTVTDLLVGRRLPVLGQSGGYGVWLANQMCDFVQLRSRPGRTTIRLLMRLESSGSSAVRPHH